ncbi:MAG TPA: hypothetical protein VEK79_04530 [Thermoanaerobaculia bacterium]|nr:hypothetical protein [Thermoanaerobaculia bacterium]
MHKAIATSVVLLFVVAGCASSAPSAETASAPSATAPEILIVQTSSMPAAARFVEGALPVQYALRIENRAADPIKLRQVTLQSVSQGAYYLSPTTRPYDLTIGPSQREEVRVQATAQAGQSLVGNNGPVTLRVTCNFEGADGKKFQQVVMRRVNERTDITGEQ